MPNPLHCIHHFQGTLSLLSNSVVLLTSPGWSITDCTVHDKQIQRQAANLQDVRTQHKSNSAARIAAWYVCMTHRIVIASPALSAMMEMLRAYLERPELSIMTSARSIVPVSINASFSCCHVVFQGRLCTTTCKSMTVSHETFMKHFT